MPLGSQFQFRSDLRRAIIFGRLDLLSDAPISRVDLLACRNVLMYFNVEAQARILSHLHFALNDDGVLFLGRAETVPAHKRFFVPMSLNNRILRIAAGDRVLALTDNGGEGRGNNMGQVRLSSMVFETGPFAQIVVDADYNLVLGNEQARLIFGLKAEDTGRPFHELELSYRPADLRSLIEQAYEDRQSVHIANVERPVSGQDSQYFDVFLVPFFDPSSGDRLGVSILFDDVSLPAQLRTELERSKQEVETMAEEVQSTNEELETTNEELQSTNTELQAINDELLVTSERSDRLNVFLNSILSSVRSGVVVVDRNLAVQLWNTGSEQLWGLREEEVTGQSLLSLDTGLPTAELAAPIRAALDGTSQEVVLKAVNRRGKPLQVTVSVDPLSGSQPKPLGAVLLIEES